MPILFDDIGKTFETREGREVVALKGVTTSIADGEFVTLIGPSGCGKSTLLSILAGLEKPTTGALEFTEGSSLAAGTRPGLLFQKPVLLPWRTAMENVLLPAEVGPGARGDGNKKVQPDIRERAHALLELMGLDDFSQKYPWELSGGMQQRVAIARGLLRDSRVLLFDEPFSALDEFTREQMNAELLEIWRREGFTVVFVTHNVFEAVFLSDRVFVMTPRPGRLAAEVEIDLPRPRHADLLGSSEFASEVGRVRKVMDEHWTRS